MGPPGPAQGEPAEIDCPVPAPLRGWASSSFGATPRGPDCERALSAVETWKWFVALAFLGFSALCSGSETALTALGETRARQLQEAGGRRAQQVFPLRGVANPHRTRERANESVSKYPPALRDTSVADPSSDCYGS